MKGTAKPLTLVKTQEVDTYSEAEAIVKAAMAEGRYATQHCQFQDYTKPGAFVVNIYEY